MITIAEKDFCYIHVPKTGGMTLRLQIADMDDYDLRFGSAVELHGGRKVRMAHLPTSLLRDEFPDVFSTIAGLSKFAVVREPISRFRSAIGQHLKETHGVFGSDLKTDELMDKVNRICDEIVRSDGKLSAEYTHFARQTDFTHLDGARFVENIYPIEMIEDLFAVASEKIGRALDHTMRINQSVNFKVPAMTGPTIKAKDQLKKVLPLSIYSRIKDVAIYALAKRGPDPRLSEIESKTGMRDFIRDYYSEDFELYSTALATKTNREAASYAH